ncbi:GlmU family protein [Pedobacter sp. MC2016-14]|uniref:GlmU family protein n=1 Tax=Pedobacter sp. MC2016-14 TaxID=2897327 RepID=UPI001E3A9412|nr:GlmU family protein [Pedobacter sp. MC2016-14]MCD0490680.1 GlmU family protein [Pedobacter sp. MC2016-14]
MTVNLFDDGAWESLRPLTYTRPVADLRVGILTIAEKWAKHLDMETGFSTQSYLSAKFRSVKSASFSINGSVCPDEQLVYEIRNLKVGESLVKKDILIAYAPVPESQFYTAHDFTSKEYSHDLTRLVFPEDIFKFNDAELKKDFKLLTVGRISAKLSATNSFIGDSIFVEEGATAECSTFNSLNGPIYLGKNSEIWEGCNIRGSFALGENSQVKMGSKIYGQTTIGPYSRVGGEINNAIIWGYSSKGHEGYLGNSVVGQWCNIGADSNNSNLKNNYAEVKLWEYAKESFRKTGLQFCGLIMADHAKCGINTMFNTGTVAGVSANIFGSGFPRNFIPDFAWGGAQGFETYSLEKMFDTAAKVYSRRALEFDQQEKDMLTEIYNITAKYRHF